MGDIVYCEVMQGLASKKDRDSVDELFGALAKYEMMNFEIAERAAANYRFLRSKGSTVRKTIDVIIGTFCIENDFPIIHWDRDFDLMEQHLGLKCYSIR